jgi:hypothetical protein
MKMKKKIGLVFFSVLALLGTFLPVASAGDFYIGISELKGLSLLLYLVAFALLVLSIVNIYKEIKHIKAWFIGTSVLGLVILLITAASVIANLNYIIQSEYAFMMRFFGLTTSSAGPDLGTYLMALGFLGILGLSLFPERKEQQTA